MEAASASPHRTRTARRASRSSLLRYFARPGLTGSELATMTRTKAAGRGVVRQLSLALSLYLALPFGPSALSSSLLTLRKLDFKPMPCRGNRPSQKACMPRMTSLRRRYALLLLSPLERREISFCLRVKVPPDHKVDGKKHKPRRWHTYNTTARWATRNRQTGGRRFLQHPPGESSTRSPPRSLVGDRRFSERSRGHPDTSHEAKLHTRTQEHHIVLWSRVVLRAAANCSWDKLSTSRRPRLSGSPAVSPTRILPG